MAATTQLISYGNSDLIKCPSPNESARLTCGRYLLITFCAILAGQQTASCVHTRKRLSEVKEKKVLTFRLSLNVRKNRSWWFLATYNLLAAAASQKCVIRQQG
uniref:(northern house mosquito) hypothetical protein n=1 Tax=Culex pipiens TaxID=7175 RepID=A0A8D8CDW2_CULPI